MAERYYEIPNRTRPESVREVSSGSSGPLNVPPNMIFDAEHRGHPSSLQGPNASHPNGKQHFSARTILYPCLFIIIHFTLQIFAAVIAMGVYMRTHNVNPFTWAMDAGTVQTIVAAIQLPTLLYSAPVQIVVYLIFLWIRRRKDPFYLLLRPNSKMAIPLGVGSALGMLGVSGLLVFAFSMLAENNRFWQQTLENYMQSTTYIAEESNYWLLTLCIAVLVPVAEELLFRGIVTEEIRRVAPDWLAVIIGGTAFALVHGNPVQVAYVFPLSLLLGAAYIWTNSIWVPIAMHMVYNFFGGSFSQLIQDNETAQMIYGVAVILMIPVGVICGILMWLHHRKQKIIAAEQPF
ncbi:MAG: CPBP family intramembrane glutamic endopeptidase [Fastidiosipilaceae bacterium]